MITLQGKCALVTGGSRGIGRAVAECFGLLGARVAIAWNRDRQAAEDTLRRLSGWGAQAVALQADLARPEQARRLVDQAAAHWGRLDVLVVNHGIWKQAPLVSMTDEQWNETVQVNLTGAWAVCQQAARHMMGQRAGAMVLVSSTAGQRGEAEYSHYAATKGGLLAFTRSLAAELAPHGIRVNAVAPGWVMSDMTREALQGPRGAEAAAKIPLGRVGEPHEIAGPVAFLASDMSSYMYGEVLAVNGGAVMTG